MVGVVTAAHGITGEVKVKSFTAVPGSLGVYGPLQTDDGRQFAVSALRPAGADLVILRLSGVGSRDEAEALKGTKLFVPREALPAPAPGEFYHDDLIGLDARSPGGDTLGRITSVMNFGAGDILEITSEDGATELVPFSDRHVPVVDFEKRVAIIEIPDTEDE